MEAKGGYFKLLTGRPEGSSLGLELDQRDAVEIPHTGSQLI